MTLNRDGFYEYEDDISLDIHGYVDSNRVGDVDRK
jgi:hypothetical protein